jgi:capsular exopolysaccharide synthesis family protein
MTDSPRYSSLQDYLRVIRRRWRWVVLIALAFLGAAIAISLSQTPIYSATASVSFRDPLQDLGPITPTDTVLEESPQVRSARNAELITRPEVTREVKSELDADLSTDELVGSISATVDSVTNLVSVTGTSTKPRLAARIANTYALVSRRVGLRETEARLERASASLRKQIQKLRGDESPYRQLQISAIQQQILRVESLRRISQPVRIARRAIAPDEPFAPETSRNVALGAIVGIFFGLLGAFARDVLDRRLQHASEVHEELGLAVLGRIADTALGQPGLAQNGTERMTDVDFEAFRMLRMNLGALDPGAGLRSLAVTSALPEEGKSTVSMSLASAVALSGQRVLLVECDLRRPSFAPRLGIDRAPGLSDYLLGSASPSDVLQVVSLGQPKSTVNGSSGEAEPVARLACIAAGSPVANTAELLLTERFQEFLKTVSQAYDLVVLDTSPLLVAADTLELVPQVDGVLVCVRVQRTTREEARAARTALSHMPERPMAAVVTGLHRHGSEFYGYYYGE